VTLLADNQLPAAAHPEMNDRNTALMQELHTNHGAGLWRYALRQHPQIADDSERSPRRGYFASPET